VIEAFRAGARGLFSRHESLETLSKCVRRVYEGQIWANTEQVGFAIEALAGSPTVRAVGANGMELLSRRELEVVRCLAEGLSNREIAKRLGLSQHTIKNYLFRVFDKLGVSSRLELLSLTLTQPNLQTNHSPEKPANSQEEDVDEALQAAERGSPSAQAALAWRYWQGKGVPADPVAAFTWYLVSERSSDEIRDEANAAKRKLAETMTSDQVMEAQRRAAEKLRKVRNEAAANITALSASKRTS
jgi:DNA-binding CsgD family transcriptional regulator